jgi:hypothetical protein
MVDDGDTGNDAGGAEDPLGSGTARYCYVSEAQRVASQAWWRTCDHDAARSDLEVDLVVEETGDVVSVPNVHRAVLVSYSSYFRLRLLRDGMQEVHGRCRETLPAQEVAVAPGLIDSLYTDELPPGLDLPALLAFFKLTDRWSLFPAIGRACALAVADRCCDPNLPLEALLSVRFPLFDSPNFRRAARAFKVALLVRFRDVAGVVTSAERSAQLGLLPVDALDDLLRRPIGTHPNDIVLMLMVWASAHQDTLGPGPLATRLGELLRRSVPDLGRLSASYCGFILPQQPWSPPPSELLTVFQQVRFWHHTAALSRRRDLVTFTVPEDARAELRNVGASFTDVTYFGGYWWRLRLRTEPFFGLIRARLCVETPPRHIEGMLPDRGGVIASVRLSEEDLGVSGLVVPVRAPDAVSTVNIGEFMVCNERAFDELRKIDLTFVCLS